jgi:DNA-binding MarR family transcriptional regulator
MKITDPRALRALAHPLRFDLIELLGTRGPMTAADCARRLGTSQASCSFHLRQLAKYGFVEAARSSGDSRERPWRLTDLEQSWSSETGPAVDQLDRVFIQREADRMLGWVGRSATEPAPWLDAAFLGGATIPVTSDELCSIRAQLRAVLEPYADRLAERSDWPADARFVRVLLSAVPLDEVDKEHRGNSR